ncbi:integral membrane protein DUF6 [Amanita rubescens]|nr:integral membrane protein DUF6 [Amanita rubescens]
MLRALVKNNAGLLLVVASEAFYVFMRASVKVLTSEGGSAIPISEVRFLRSVVTYVFSVAYMYCTKIDHPILGPPHVRFLLLCRGFSEFIGIFGMYYALQYLSLSDSVVLGFLSPLSTAIAGSLILNEKFKKGEAVAGIISLLGVVLIARPPFIFGSNGHNEEKDEHGVTIGHRMIAVCVSLISTLGFTSGFITIRAIGKRAHPLHNMAYLSFPSAIICAAGIILTRTPVVVPTERLYLSMLVLIGVFGFFAQILMIIGFQIEAAGRASLGIYSKVIFTLILERVVFGTTPGLLSILGTFLILGSGIYVTATKAREGGDSEGSNVEEGCALLNPHEDSNRQHTDVES